MGVPGTLPPRHFELRSARSQSPIPGQATAALEEARERYAAAETKLLRLEEELREASDGAEHLSGRVRALCPRVSQCCLGRFLPGPSASDSSKAWFLKGFRAWPVGA